MIYRSSLSSILKSTDLAIASNNENTKAQKKLFTSNPDTSQSAMYKIITLITSRNKPSVTIVIGKVSITRMGFTIKLRIDKDKATRIALM